MDKELLQAQLKDLALKHFNIAGLAADVLVIILEPALDKMVKDSENPYDDMAKAALYPVLSQFLLEAIDELIAKLQEPSAE